MNDSELNYAVLETEILEKINSFKLVCPVCGLKDTEGGGEFHVINGILNIPIQDNSGGTVFLGGRVLPSIAVICSRCGHTLYFALKSLLPRLISKMEDK